MSQLGFLGFQAQVMTVAEITRYVRSLLEADYRLQDVWVAGEVSNISRPSSGHLYFTLKDAQASLRCVMWRSNVEAQSRPPREGESLEVHGHISVYEAGGQYQLYADVFRPAGEGELYQAFLRLKARLEAEGLFAPARKRPLPAWPRGIGLVTSPTGAALRDVIDVLRRRFPLAGVVLAPTSVQGPDAPTMIADALRALNQVVKPDVILLVRGGGSMEDLAAFNDEGVARAVAASEAPVVSGVGHETDFTIADFVADLRAPTPSAAAEVASPDQIELTSALDARRSGLVNALSRHVQARRGELEARRTALRLASPRAQLANARQRLDDLTRRSMSAVHHMLKLRGAEVSRLSHTLRAVGPPAVLERGYALVSRQRDGAVVRAAAQVEPQERIDVRLSRGALIARVEEAKDEATSD